ncbi:transposase [Salinibacter ruber]|uniref:transposase n=1 Tax=Salinibacter ruber TaxID=146919 RepID=UPI0021696E07|nr:transposase [Salinibacter ruber]
MHQTLCQHLPEELSKPQRRNLSWVIAGLHQAGHVHFSKVASKRVGSATLESKTRQVRRFFSNEQVDPQCCYEPVAELLLKQAIASGSPIRVLVDTLELSGERQVLMGALAHRRRALPVCWQVRRRTGVSDAEQQRGLLEALSKRIDDACDDEGACDDVPEVIVIGDGAFHSTDLMSYLSEKGWSYRLRLHSDTYVQLSNGKWTQVGDLAPEEGGENRYFNAVYVTKGDPYGPVSIAICHAEGEDDPWFICTDQPEADYLTLRTYSRRMWIEELFGDLEDGGFRLNRSRLYQPERLSRLVMALAWTYVWLMHVGVWAVKRGVRRLVDRTDRRDRSYPEIGRRYIQRCVTNGKPIHIGLKPYFRKLSGS